jgi:hypothetical protein
MGDFGVTEKRDFVKIYIRMENVKVGKHVVVCVNQSICIESIDRIIYLQFSNHQGQGKRQSLCRVLVVDQPLAQFLHLLVVQQH